MATGIVTTIRDDRGFGFLAPEGGHALDAQDLFFHHTSVPGGRFSDLRQGQRVRYEEGADPRDPGRRRAVDVRPLNEES